MKLPRGSKRFNSAPQVLESGFLYFVIERPQDPQFWLKVPSKGTQRAVRYWLNRLVDWHDVSMVTHYTGSAVTSMARVNGVGVQVFGGEA